MSSILHVSLGLLLIVWATWRFLPRCIHLALPEMLRIGFEPCHDLCHSDVSEGLRSLIQSLDTLGFTVIGVKTESFPLWGTLRELTLACSDCRCYASIPIQTPPSVFYLLTHFTDGSVILTANHGFPERSEHDCVVTNVHSNNPAVALERHCALIDEWVDFGRSPVASLSESARIAATEAFYRTSSSRRRMRQIGFMNAVALVLAVVAATWLSFGAA